VSECEASKAPEADAVYDSVLLRMVILAMLNRGV
jgi:hypothetical protein